MIEQAPVKAEQMPGKRGAAMAAALTRLAEMNALSDICGAAAWEQEERQDRELAGRNAYGNK